MMISMRQPLLSACFVVALCVASCNEYEDPPPPSPTVPDVAPTRFSIEGDWNGITDQGRDVRFQVRNVANVMSTELSLHHDCSGGRIVLDLDGFESTVSGDRFSENVTWRYDEPGGKYYIGTLTVTGTFTSDRAARGSFINSITEKQVDNLGVCGPTNGTWEAFR